MMGWICLDKNVENVKISIKKETLSGLFVMAEDMGLEPTGLLHLT